MKNYSNKWETNVSYKSNFHKHTKKPALSPLVLGAQSGYDILKQHKYNLQKKCLFLHKPLFPAALSAIKESLYACKAQNILKQIVCEKLYVLLVKLSIKHINNTAQRTSHNTTVVMNPEAHTISPFGLCQKTK